MQEQISELEKLIYNKHLLTSRRLRNKPCKSKKDFSDIANTDKHKFLKRISNLFKKHSEIDVDVFFQAPYILYPDVEYFGLEYFSSMRAVRSYTLYKKQLFLQDPDSQLDSVKDSVKFIANFCIQNNLYLHQYPQHRTADMYTWMKHYKENKVNLYCMFMFSGVFSSVKELSQDLQTFFVSNFVEQFHTLHTKYNNSKEVKAFLTKAYSKISKFVENRVVKH